MVSMIFFKISKEITCVGWRSESRLPKVAPTIRNSNSQIIQTVQEYRDTLVNFFQNIVDNPDDWDTETYLTSHGFLAFVHDFDFVFLLSVFN
jgi:hypothetical protein